jgi:DNA-3-methyladenine glycosylase II
MEVLDEAGFLDAVDRLCDGDPMLAAAVERHGTPDFWTRPPGFATLVLFVLEQQVSLASARAAYDRLVSRTGGVTPHSIMSSTDDELRADGFSRQKTRYVRLLAEDTLTGELDLDGLAGLPDDDARDRLLALTGIGPWTADVYLLSCLRRPDVWPVGDRALQVGTAELLALDDVPSSAELAAVGERWKPLRSAAARIVWHSYLTARGRT